MLIINLAMMLLCSFLDVVMFTVLFIRTQQQRVPAHAAPGRNIYDGARIQCADFQDLPYLQGLHRVHQGYNQVATAHLLQVDYRVRDQRCARSMVGSMLLLKIVTNEKASPHCRQTGW